MDINVIVVDDFYRDPNEVRNFALKQDFKVRGNFPGKRSKSFLNENLKQSIETILYPYAGKVVNWREEEFTGSFQITNASDRSWIHTDGSCNWAGVLYLTPDAPLTSGTGLYKRKITNSQTTLSFESETLSCFEPYDLSRWELVDEIGNIFNRLVLYRGNLWHSALNFFGSNDIEGRLFQTFFIETEIT